ncbi:MAG: OsmC family peroxiredoxin [Candidatus Dormibacteraeota bacterium]|nr:OsmC family peroxiredoxin [Candidatus Dormibacteraeota bacterium]
MSAPSRLRYEVRAELSAGGRAVVQAGSTAISFDASAEPESALPGPADLLAAALAACLSKNIERFSHILEFRYRRAMVRVEVERQQSPPRIARSHYVIQIDTEESDRRLELLHLNLRRHGTISNTLAASGELSGELTRWGDPSEPG